MRRVCFYLIALTIVTLTTVGCGGSGEEITATTVSPETSTTQVAPAETSTTQAAVKTSTTQAAADDEWVTVATLSSTDAPWQDMEGLLMSDPFTAAGEAQLVLDMPDGGELDGVIVGIIPADKATSLSALLEAVQEGIVVTLPATLPTRAISGLDGTYVLVNSVPQTVAWSVELQTRP